MPDQAATTTAHGVVQRGREHAAVQAAEQCATSQCPFSHLGPRQLLTAITVGLAEPTWSAEIVES